MMALLTPRERSLASRTLSKTVERVKLTEEHKLIIANLICERKDVLFGRRSDTVTPRTRKLAWEEVMDECRRVYGFYAVAPDKGYQHLRNHVWSDMKTAVIKKLRHGGLNQFTRLDHAILEVIGEQEQPIVMGGGRSGARRAAPEHIDDDNSHLDPPPDDFPAVEETSMLEAPRPTAPRRVRVMVQRMVPSANPPPPMQEQHRPPPMSPNNNDNGDHNYIDERPAPMGDDRPMPVNNSPPRPWIRNRKRVRRPAVDNYGYQQQQQQPTASAHGRIVGVLPVVDPQSFAFQSMPFAGNDQRRRRRQQFTEDEDDEDDDGDREMVRLKKQLLSEKIEHYRLMNEKLKLELDQLRSIAPPPTTSD